jgi:RNA polymerase sigma-B factor
VLERQCRERQEQLLRQYHATGDAQARAAAIEHFLPLARSLARRHHRGLEPLEDLEQVASLALIVAVDRFDPARGTAFSSFAVPLINGAILRHFRDHCWCVRVPRELRELALKVDRTSDLLRAETGTTPTANEVARRIGVEVEDVLEARAAYGARHSESLDQASVDGAEESLVETLGEWDANLDRAFDRAALDAALAALVDDDRELVELYRRNLSQREIGRRLGCSQMHVSRRLRRALTQLSGD